ncbi:MAG: xanthine dehydrogenase family protein subunit M [Chitinophagaceae bacterium]
MINFEYTRVKTVKAAVDALSKSTGNGLIAGGTNLVDLMKRGVTTHQKLIDINQLQMDFITDKADSIQVGALVRNSDLSEHPQIQQQFPLLSLALKAGASAQLRNMATVGGNMMQRTRCTYFYDLTMPCNKRKPGSGCGALKGYNRMHAIFGASEQCIAVHPSDMCVALAALDATITVEGNKGTRTIAFGDFHRLPGTNPEKDNTLRPGEIITLISIPKAGFTRHVSYVKIRDRASYAFALVSVAAALDMDGDTIRSARLAMGGVAHKPWRLTAAEKFLEGKKAGTAIFEQTATIAMQGATGYGANNFKLKLGPATIVEALNKASQV